MNNNLFIYFYNGPFSQWYNSEFEEDGIRFSNCEQYMMWRKAVLFKDNITANIILKTDSPKVCKELGRKVDNFVPEIWDKHKLSIVIQGNFLKFSQNEDLKRLLISTSDRILVEASPEDSIWGVGLNKEIALSEGIFKWKGTNLLGFALMSTRILLKYEK